MAWRSSKTKPPPKESEVLVLIYLCILLSSVCYHLPCISQQHSHIGFHILCELLIAKVSHLSAAPSQDATSSVFAKVSHLSAAPSQDATSLGWSVHCHLCLPRCLTFQQHPVKMPHLWAGPFTVICVCQGVSPFSSTQSRCHIFGLVRSWSSVFAKVSHLSAAPSQDATSLGWSVHCHLCLPRCLTFRQHPVKMPHLWAGPFTVICVCQGVSPFGSTQSRCHIFGLVRSLSSVFAKVSHLSVTPSQDATSLGWSGHCHLCLPKCLA